MPWAILNRPVGAPENDAPRDDASAFPGSSDSSRWCSRRRCVGVATGYFDSPLGTPEILGGERVRDLNCPAIKPFHCALSEAPTGHNKIAQGIALGTRDVNS